MRPDLRDVALVCAAVLVTASGAVAAPPSPPARSTGASSGSTSGTMAQAPYPQPPSTVSADAAARARMHECGHQWSSMKRLGTTGPMTWKEFSATCLVVR